VSSQVEVDEVPDIEIEPTVTVVVEEEGRHAPAPVVGAGTVGDISEGPITVVAKKAVRPMVGHVEIDPAVSIVVTGSDSHAITGRDDPALFGDVGETEPGLTGG
jgi:hypothetical protein